MIPTPTYTSIQRFPVTMADITEQRQSQLTWYRKEKKRLPIPVAIIHTNTISYQVSRYSAIPSIPITNEQDQQDQQVQMTLNIKDKAPKHHHHHRHQSIMVHISRSSYHIVSIYLSIPSIPCMHLHLGCMRSSHRWMVESLSNWSVSQTPTSTSTATSSWMRGV